jgi:hypothetical protein
MTKIVAFVCVFFMLMVSSVHAQQVTLTASSGFLSGTFNTLKGAFDAINAGTHRGNIVIKINESTIETERAFLAASGNGGITSYTSINIYPTSDGLIISGSLDGSSLITLSGADNVTIDGRVNATGSSKSLTITNISSSNLVGTSAIQFFGDASSNTVKYCTLKGSSKSSVSGIVFFNVGISTGNDNNTIDNNDITSNDDIRPLNAIYAGGNLDVINNNNSITNNNIFNFLAKATASYGINIGSFNSTYTISGNSFYETASFAATANVNYIVINIAASGGGNGFIVSDNYIGGTAPLCGGGAWTKTGSSNAFTGVQLNTANGVASSIQGNTIQKINWTNNTGTPFVAIQVQGATNVDIGTTTGNLIGAASGNNSIQFTAENANLIAINLPTSGNVNCSNNTIGAIRTRSSPISNCNFLGIQTTVASTGIIAISNNTIGSTSTAGSITASSTFTGNQATQGMRIQGAGTHSISGNTIANFINSGTGTGNAGLTCGINASNNGSNDISNNTIRDLYSANNTNTTTLGSINGIILASVSGNSVQIVSGNTVYNLTNSNTDFSGEVRGIYFQNNTTATNSSVRSNFIHSLSVTGASSTSASIYGIKIVEGATNSRYGNNIISIGGNTSTNVYGIYENGTASSSNSLYFNTVYLSGSLASGTSNNSYALYSAVNTNTRNFRNNVLVNARSTADGVSKHYALYLPTTGGTLTSDYNNYYVSGIGGVLGFYGENVSSLPIVVGVTGNDANSIATNPSFVSTGTTASGYTPSLAGTAVDGTGITLDYNGNARGASLTMGALPPSTCNNPTSAGTIAAAQSGPSGFNPVAFTSSAAASGQTGTLEYKWQSSTTSSSAGFSDIASSNAATYDAGALTQTTWFKRLARVDCESNWSGAVESNVLEVTICVAILTQPISVKVAENSDATFSVSASGTDLSYLWQQSIDGINWSSSFSQTLGDNASNYGGSWSNGSNQGSGFGPWDISAGANTGFFIGNPSNGEMGTDGIGTTSFGAYARGTEYVYMNRSLTSAMQVGDILSFWWAINFDALNGNKGFDLKSGNSVVFNVNNTNDPTITTTNGTANTGYNKVPMLVTIERTSASSYSFSMTSRTNGPTYTTTINSSSAIDAIRFYIGDQRDSHPNRDMYFNNFSIVKSVSSTTNSTLTIPAAMAVQSSGVKYRCIVTAACGSVTSNEVELTNIKSWIGGSGNWSVAANWNGGVLPVSNDDIVINSGNPQLDINFSINGSLTLASSTSLNLSTYNLTLSGNLTNSGSITGTGILELNGSSAQQISGNGTVNNIKINNASGVSITSGSNKLNVTGLCTPTSGVLTTNGNLVFRSTATQEGVVGTAGTCPTEPISGDVTVEKYISAKRAFRFLTPGVTTSTNINTNWQEGSRAIYTISYPYVAGSAENPNAGYGTHITGAGGANNGFDVTVNNNPSLFTYDVSANTGSGGWIAESNTNVNANVMRRGEAYRLLVRGSRGVDLNNNAATPDATTLRTTGTLSVCETMSYTTTSVVPLSSAPGGFSFIGNPYWSVINWGLIFGESPNIEPNLYYWDPTVNGFNNRGAYVTLNPFNNSNSLQGSSNLNSNIQPGQAFFVQNTADVNGTSVLPSITISQSHVVGTRVHKVALFGKNNLSAGGELGMDDQQRIRGNAPIAIEKIYVSLLIKNKVAAGPADGFLVAYNQGFTDTYGKEDAGKFTNLDENITAVYNGKRQSILGLQSASGSQIKSDTIPISMTNLYDGEYLLKVSIDKSVSPVREVYVVNRVTKQQYKVDYTKGLELSFLNSITKTKDDLALVVNSQSIPNPVRTRKQLVVFPNPVTTNTVEVIVPNISGKNDMMNKPAYVEILSSNNQIVFTQNVTLDATGKATLDVSSLTSGGYLVRVYVDRNSFTTKLIKP